MVSAVERFAVRDGSGRVVKCRVEGPPGRFVFGSQSSASEAQREALAVGVALRRFPCRDHWHVVGEDSGPESWTPAQRRRRQREHAAEAG